MADIEEHLGVTIDVVDVDIKIETNQFDGKVVYGQKKKSAGSVCKPCERCKQCVSGASNV